MFGNYTLHSKASLCIIIISDISSKLFIQRTFIYFLCLYRPAEVFFSRAAVFMHTDQSVKMQQITSLLVEC